MGGLQLSNTPGIGEDQPKEGVQPELEQTLCSEQRQNQRCADCSGVGEGECIAVDAPLVSIILGEQAGKGIGEQQGDGIEQQTVQRPAEIGGKTGKLALHHIGIECHGGDKQQRHEAGEDTFCFPGNKMRSVQEKAQRQEQEDLQHLIQRDDKCFVHNKLLLPIFGYTGGMEISPT